VRGALQQRAAGLAGRGLTPEARSQINARPSSLPATTNSSRGPMKLCIGRSAL